MTDAIPSEVRLHPHRGIGWGVYGSLTVFVLTLVLIGTVSYVVNGRYVMALVTMVAGLALAAFLGVLTHAMVVPDLAVDAAGIRGRSPRGAKLDIGWDDVTVDMDEKKPGLIRLGLGTESVLINPRSWVGGTDFILLVAATPEARDRLTPAALQEWLRLLGVSEG